MAWKDNLQTASYKGVEFPIQSVSDKGARATAAHEYPYRDGSDVEDLGLKGDQISVRAIFWGDDYEVRLNALLQALRSPGAGVLMHPVFGEVKNALPTSWSVEHNEDGVDSATMAIEFVNSLAHDKPFTAPSPLVMADKAVASADAARKAADNGLTAYIVKLRTSAPLARLTALKDKLNQSLANAKRLMDLTPVKTLLSEFDYVLYPSAFMADLRATFDVALQGLPFGGRNNSYTLDAATPSSGVDNFNQVLALTAPNAMRISTANDTIAPALAIADQAAVQAHGQVHGAATLAEAAMMVLAGEADEPLLNRNELEKLTNQTRSVCQAAIDAAHAAYPNEQSQAIADSLREVAFYVQQAATDLLNQRPAIGRRPAPVAGPLRLVAQALYADPTRTPELARLNSLGRQPFINRGQELTSYAA